MTETMQVTIMYRNNWPSIGGDGWTRHPMNVEISTKCPVCGEPRGEPRAYTFCEDGEWYTVHVWTNPCGHVDDYEKVYLESLNNGR